MYYLAAKSNTVQVNAFWSYVTPLMGAYVADQYLGQTQNETGAGVADKFQTLSREVMNTSLADLRKIGEQKYFNKKENKYTVFIAYEIKKNAMFRFMKKQAKTNQQIDERQQEVIQKILDEELKKTEDEGN